MDIRNNRDELQTAADFVVIRRQLKGGGIASIAFGAVAVVNGIPAMSDHPINVILVLLGVLLAIEGIWILTKPSPGGLIAEGIVFALLGIWNISVTVLGVMAAPDELDIFMGIMGLVQLGVQMFCKYAKFAHLKTRSPQPDAIDWVEDQLAYLKQSKPKTADDVLQFNVEAAAWRPLLMPDGAVFDKMNGQDVVIARPDDIDIHSFGKRRKTRQVIIALADREIKGKIKQTFLDRYETWKAGLDAAAVAETAAAPATTAPPPLPPTTGPVTVRCICGRTWEFDAEHIGQESTCPECGATLLIQSGTATA